MRLDPNPLFRRVIAPWYDSTMACWLLLVFMVMIILFGVVGIWVAAKEPDYTAYIWVPVLLCVLCLTVCASIVKRLVYRYYDRYAPSREL